MSNTPQKLLDSPHVKRLPDGELKIEGKHGLLQIWDIGMGFAVIAILAALWMTISDGYFQIEIFGWSITLLGICWLCDKLTDSFYSLNIERKQVFYTRDLTLHCKRVVICRFDEVHALSMSGKIQGEGSGRDPANWTYRVALIKRDGAVTKISGELNFESSSLLAELIAETLESEFIPGRPMHELHTTDSQIKGVPEVKFVSRTFSRSQVFVMGVLLALSVCLALDIV